MTRRAALELDTLTIRIPMRLQRRDGRKLIMTPEGVAAPARKPSCDETLVKALVRAHRWRRKIESGQARSITDLAAQESVTDATSAGSYRSPAWRRTSWRRSWTGSSRRGSGRLKCWGMGRSSGTPRGRPGASAIDTKLLRNVRSRAPGALPGSGSLKLACSGLCAEAAMPPGDVGLQGFSSRGHILMPARRAATSPPSGPEYRSPQ
jgi:hypothetical protein